MKQEKYILFGVLNWGLGHATRSVSLIKALKKQGYTPVIASDGLALQYLQKEFPEALFEELPTYNIKYGGHNFLRTIGGQLPKLAYAIFLERRYLKRLVKKYKAVGVISDNRLGFYSLKVPSVYITHQLKILLQAPFSMANYFHHYFINKYTHCWIPDVENAYLAGRMVLEKKPKIPYHFIGPLSRFESCENKDETKIYDAAFVLSGPEPQRSLLEDKIVAQLKNLSGNYILVRGTDKPMHNHLKSLKCIDLAYGDILVEIIKKSKIVVSRSGYSSIMDYYFLGNKALLIPTPGQVEQEYLAEHLEVSKVFKKVSQKDVCLEKDLKEALTYNGFVIVSKESQFDRGALFSLFEGK